MDDSISWVATALTVTAALMTASNLGSRITGYGFAVFALGSVAWITTGVMTSQPALTWTNGVLLLLNLFGVWRWLGRQAKIEEGGRIAQHHSEETPGEALFPASMLCRAPIVDGQGRKIAQGVDAMIGGASGRIAYLVASDGGLTGVGETLRRIDWPDVGIDDENIRCCRDFGQLREIAKDEWPG
ncbi:PRC-barrel domain-containing protein [Sphingomonas xanthus]|uniref:PRC-barrel domain containing protein n=1 Tax=Sphingomonas xanthus TaxID=2594473 RepID=A0A516IP05_9SPHN|nr:PRC-barrel domain-containing protein [Sphingomonas xanthus]QDP18651.1 PRC-barrel domain containing protein [Sphingomonas xanthus]